MRMRFIALAAPLILLAGPPMAGSGPPPTVSDTLLLSSNASNVGLAPPFIGVAIFHPRTGLFEPLLENATEPVASPDGRELLFVQQREQRLAIVDLAADTLRQRWVADVFSTPEQRQAERPWLRLAASRDRVFAALHVANDDRTTTIFALDRVDGFIRTQWTTELPTASGGVDLHIVADGSELDMLAHPNSPGPQAIYRFRLPDGALLAPPAPITNNPGGSEWWARRPLPDGRGLFGIAEPPPGQAMKISFLDVATASIEQLELPIRAPARAWLPHEDGLSPDGRHLYVYAPTLNQVVVVDLAQRRVEQAATVDMSAVTPSALARAWGMLGNLLVQTAEAKTPFVGNLQLTPDGQRMYAVGMSSAQNDFRMDGVLAIDTQTWRVSSRWLPNTEITQLLLSADASALFVQEMPWATTRSAGVVHVLETTNGVETATSSALPLTSLHSVRGLFADRYGFMPSSMPATLPPPVPALIAEVSPRKTVGGQPIQVEVRFADPRTGQRLTTDSDFKEPSQVTARATRDGSEATDVSVMLQRSALGIYRGSLSVPAPVSGSNGWWTVQGMAEWPDGLRRRIELRDALFVSPTFPGADGHTYVLDVTTDPPNPRVHETARLRAAFVDADRATPLPDDVDLVDRLPDRLHLDFFGAGSSARQLESAAHGVYDGEVQLWAPGDWRVWAVITRLEGASDTFLTGSISVQP